MKNETPKLKAAIDAVIEAYEKALPPPAGFADRRKTPTGRLWYYQVCLSHPDDYFYTNILPGEMWDILRSLSWGRTVKGGEGFEDVVMRIREAREALQGHAATGPALFTPAEVNAEVQRAAKAQEEWLAKAQADAASGKRKRL